MMAHNQLEEYLISLDQKNKSYSHFQVHMLFDKFIEFMKILLRNISYITSLITECVIIDINQLLQVALITSDLPYLLQRLNLSRISIYLLVILFSLYSFIRNQFIQQSFSLYLLNLLVYFCSWFIFIIIIYVYIIRIILLQCNILLNELKYATFSYITTIKHIQNSYLGQNFHHPHGPHSTLLENSLNSKTYQKSTKESISLLNKQLSLLKYNILKFNSIIILNENENSIIINTKIVLKLAKELFEEIIINEINEIIYSKKIKIKSFIFLNELLTFFSISLQLINILLYLYFYQKQLKQLSKQYYIEKSNINLNINISNITKTDKNENKINKYIKIRHNLHYLRKKMDSISLKLWLCEQELINTELLTNVFINNNHLNEKSNDSLNDSNDFNDLSDKFIIKSLEILSNQSIQSIESFECNLNTINCIFPTNEEYIQIIQQLIDFIQPKIQNISIINTNELIITNKLLINQINLQLNDNNLSNLNENQINKLLFETKTYENNSNNCNELIAKHINGVMLGINPRVLDVYSGIVENSNEININHKLLKNSNNQKNDPNLKTINYNKLLLYELNSHISSYETIERLQTNESNEIYQIIETQINENVENINETIFISKEKLDNSRLVRNEFQNMLNQNIKNQNNNHNECMIGDSDSDIEDNT